MTLDKGAAGILRYRAMAPLGQQRNGVDSAFTHTEER